MDIVRLTELAEASDDEHPLIALDALRGVRVELERQEAVLVRRARNGGVTWSSIAEVLGVSKQAVQQKFGRGGPKRARGGR